jgi:hypothetical protein
MSALQIRVTSAEMSILLTRAYDAGYTDGVKAATTTDPIVFASSTRAHRLFDLIRDWAFERRLGQIAAAGPIVKGDSPDAN